MLSLIEPNIHPILVHFAYALSVTSAICYLLASFKFAERWKETLRPAADCMLAFGALAIIATIAAGFQAYYSVAHDGPSHTAMTTHRNWAVPSGIAILALALWRWTTRSKPASLAFKGLLTVAALSLSVAAWWGGHIVYNYGLGVKSLPSVTGDGHDHEHGDVKADPMPKTTSENMHDNSDGHHDASSDEVNTDTGHDEAIPQGHDNSDGHHDTPIVNDAEQAIRSIISDIQAGWEQGDGTPFHKHFLDYDGARYFESGGENLGLSDLIDNHVEPEKTSIPDLKLGLSDLQIYFEGDFAWAVASTTVQGTIVKSGRIINRTGKQTWLFRKIKGDWKAVHTHSSSRAARQ